MEDYSLSDDDGGWILWSGSLVMSRLVECDDNFRSCSIAVELGAGAGLISTVMAAAGMQLVLPTEQPSVMKFLHANIDANRALIDASPGSCTPEVLSWGAHPWHDIT